MVKHVTRIEAGGAVGMVHGDKKPNALDRAALGRLVAAIADHVWKKPWVGVWKSGGDYDSGQELFDAETRAEARRMARTYGHGNVVVRKRT